MKTRFTQWLRLREEDGPTPMIGGRPVEMIDAQVTLTGNTLEIKTKKGQATIDLTPEQAQQYTQQMNNEGEGMQPNAGELPQQGSLPWTNQGS